MVLIGEEWRLRDGEFGMDMHTLFKTDNQQGLYSTENSV